MTIFDTTLHDVRDDLVGHSITNVTFDAPINPFGRGILRIQVEGDRVLEIYLEDLTAVYSVKPLPRRQLVNLEIGSHKRHP